MAGGRRVAGSHDGADPLGSQRRGAETLELTRAALATTQEKALRAGLALLRAGLLAAQRDLESGLAVLEAGAEDLATGS